MTTNPGGAAPGGACFRQAETEEEIWHMRRGTSPGAQRARSAEMRQHPSADRPRAVCSTAREGRNRVTHTLPLSDTHTAPAVTHSLPGRSVLARCEYIRREGGGGGRERG